MKYYNLVIASDHHGVELKQYLIDNLTPQIKIKDFGPNKTDNVDYPEYAAKVVEAIEEKIAEKGILICGTGIGMSIAANRHSRIRAALCTNDLMSKRARMHNDANVLALGSMIVSCQEALIITKTFLSTSFEGGRHLRRLNKIH